ncbi:hypothetical protein LRS03_26230 [Rhizobacter sp. J219]|uniref:hypothetical protein n=1 Tax=Rhizobacter sp. J219 TaxID=2898430 RepID=UPI002150960B|nr:hypothetical protein [Rhizobacter sp. J219]MCR5886159.1 hypothetical protein [Rhizobacter sp. J219]
MRTPWQSTWQGPDLVVFRDDTEVDRFPAAQVERVVFVYRGQRRHAGRPDLRRGRAARRIRAAARRDRLCGRVNFERLNFWAEKQCIYWVPEGKASLPARLRPQCLAVAPGRAVVHPRAAQ